MNNNKLFLNQINNNDKLPYGIYYKGNLLIGFKDSQKIIFRHYLYYIH
jgi:hypothetical protein